MCCSAMPRLPTDLEKDPPPMTVKVAINGHGPIGRIGRNELRATIHPYTNDPVLTEVCHEELRRARSANGLALR